MKVLNRKEFAPNISEWSFDISMVEAGGGEGMQEDSQGRGHHLLIYVIFVYFFH